MDPRWMQPIDAYCERTDPSFWSEPINALSNGVILVAGILGLIWSQQIRKTQSYPWALTVSVIIIIVSIGSFLFHTFATRWALWADVLPIMGFMLLFLAFILRKGFKLGWPQSLVILAFFMAIGYTFETRMPRHILSGSLIYTHAVVAVLIVAGLLQRKQHVLRKHLWGLAGVFLLSLSFRSLDAPLCDSLSSGTHFLWHTLNGVVMAIAVHAIIYWGRHDNKNWT